MAEVTRPATWDDVKMVARLLDEEGTRWALIGGYAVQMALFHAAADQQN